jgi:nitrite reductase/ring-hydroxylating ferredoxin subunit
MNDRRRFLHVLGATTAAVALPACGGTETTSSTGTTGAGGAGASTTSGTGGAGGGGATTSSATGSTSSTGTGGDCGTKPDGVAVGVPADFAADGLHLVPGTKVLVGRDAKGLYALTSVCTHEFCDMDGKMTKNNVTTQLGTITATGITCNCHGSEFDTLGNAIAGPVLKSEMMQNKKLPLKAYAMALGCDGKIYVDKTSVVSIDQRLDA